MFITPFISNPLPAILMYFVLNIVGYCFLSTSKLEFKILFPRGSLFKNNTFYLNQSVLVLLKLGLGAIVEA